MKAPQDVARPEEQKGPQDTFQKGEDRLFQYMAFSHLGSCLWKKKRVRLDSYLTPYTKSTQEE